MKHTKHAEPAIRRTSAFTHETDEVPAEDAATQEVAAQEVAAQEVPQSPKINLARRARKIVIALPATIRDQVREHPYRTLGLAFALGGGSGVILSSRVLRMAFGSAASVLITRLVSDFLRDEFRRESGPSTSA